MRHRGEASWVFILRGIAVLVVVTAMVVFAAHEIVILPFSEVGIIRHREYQISKYDGIFTMPPKDAEWVVIVVSLSNP